MNNEDLILNGIIALLFLKCALVVLYSNGAWYEWDSRRVWPALFMVFIMGAGPGLLGGVIVGTIGYFLPEALFVGPCIGMAVISLWMAYAGSGWRHADLAAACEKQSDTLVNLLVNARISGDDRASFVPDFAAEYRRDCVAALDGTMAIDQVVRKWSGRLPARPRPPVFLEDAPLKMPPASVGLAQSEWAPQVPQLTLVAPVHASCKVRPDAAHAGPICDCTPKDPDPEIALFKEVMAKDLGIEYVSGPAPRYREGQWVRIMEVARKDLSGQLAVVREKNTFPGNGWAYVLDGFFGCTSLVESCIEPAVPRAGEWWEYVACSTHDRHAAPWRSGAYLTQVDWDPEAIGLVFIRCGCTRPVNFGRGDAL